MDETEKTSCEAKKAILENWKKLKSEHQVELGRAWISSVPFQKRFYLRNRNSLSLPEPTDVKGKNVGSEEQGLKPWAAYLKVVVSFFLMAALLSQILWNVLRIDEPTNWMLYVSALSVGLIAVAFLVWEGPKALNDPSALGVWLWGSIMMLIALNLGAVVVFTSTQIDPTVADKLAFATKTNGSSNNVLSEMKYEPILQIFLAAKEFGSVVAVALGFASIAWVNFFTTRRREAVTPKPPQIFVIAPTKESAEQLEALVKGTSSDRSS